MSKPWVGYGWFEPQTVSRAWDGFEQKKYEKYVHKHLEERFIQLKCTGHIIRLLGAIEIHCNRAVYVSLNTNANPNPSPNPNPK